MIRVDGSTGEGGGQILRSSLALSAITGQAFAIDRIRAGRARPGLLRQHLTGVRAAAEVCGAEVEGEALGSTSLVFRPGPIRAGHYRFAVGTAGSTGLVLQTVLPMLLLADAPSTVSVEGGTHAQSAPPATFLAEVFAPLIERMGPRVAITQEAWGFYPAGGGRIVARIGPAPLRPLVLEERGAVQEVALTAVVSNLRASVAHRELKAAADALGLERRAGVAVEAASRGPGNVVWARCVAANVTELFTAFGRRGASAEDVAAELVGEVGDWLRREAPVGPHLADQLLLPIALAGSGAFVTGPPSPHTVTNAEIVARFLGRRFSFEEVGLERVRVWMG